MMEFRFDRHEWKAVSCTTAEDVEKFMDENRIYGKTIHSVKVIGMAQNMEKPALIMQLRRAWYAVGLPIEKINAGFPHMEKILLPCIVSVCEPVIIIFTDNSTLEMQMCRDGTILLAANQIPAQICDGVNRGNFNAEKLFSRLKGSSINGISLKVKTIESRSGRSAYTETSTFKKLEFQLSGNHGFYIKDTYGSWYDFGLCDSHCHTEYGCETSRISYEAMQKALRPKKQIPIVEGHDCSSYFWIMPVKWISKNQEWEMDVEEYRPEEISIEEDDVYAFLYFFLQKFYTPALQEPFRNLQLCGTDFEWNLEYNVFSYDSVRKMIALIRDYAALLETDYDNAELSELKSRFRPYQFDSEYYYTSNPLPAEDVIRENICVAVDFYERFCQRMERMMDNAPQYDLISFMGP